MIQSELPNTRVGQDLKHLLNRIVQVLSVRCPLYADACKKLHGIFVQPSITVKSRNGTFAQVRQDCTLLYVI